MNIYTCQVQIYSENQKGYVKIALILSPQIKKHTQPNLISMLLSVFLYLKLNLILR